MHNQHILLFMTSALPAACELCAQCAACKSVCILGQLTSCNLVPRNFVSRLVRTILPEDEHKRLQSKLSAVHAPRDLHRPGEALNAICSDQIHMSTNVCGHGSERPWHIHIPHEVAGRFVGI